MKKSIRAMLLCCACAVADAATVEMRHTHGVFYPGLRNQPVVQLKVTGEPGETIRTVRFNFGRSSCTGDIAVARLLSSGDWNGFTYNTNKLAVEKAKTKPEEEVFSFKTKIELGHTPQYLWLSYDLAPGVKRNARVDALCTEVVLQDGSVVKPKLIIAEGLKSRVIGRVYPFPYRVVPYYRPRWVKGWGNAKEAVHLTPAHFNLFTDIVHFAYSVTAEGDITYQWVGEGASAQEVTDDALAELKRLRRVANSRARLLAGFGHMDGPMTKAVSDPGVRRTLARRMAQWAISRGYGGIDIDWEYPDSWQEWQQLGFFIADLREELAGSGLSVSIAASVTYKVPNYWTTDQLDFLMTMSYDDLGEQHSSMWRFQGDANKCLNEFHMAKPRIVVGLPFYSNQQGTLTNQYGYSQIVGWYPNIKPGENTFRIKNADGSLGPMHSFNGINLITEKCKWLKKQKFGGVMIWAYDTDLPLSHNMSLARAMFKVIRQPSSKKKKKQGAKSAK
ncbi:MAG: hypothetical protein IJE66_06620 [Akkermansia sp.]|nr:hypothetical protein [Akkermansia sp.]